MDVNKHLKKGAKYFQNILSSENLPSLFNTVFQDLVSVYGTFLLCEPFWDLNGFQDTEF